MTLYDDARIWIQETTPHERSAALTFPDGCLFRIEIPTVEGPAAFEAVIAQAERLEVPVTRISQGSGIDLLTDTEITRMVELGADHGIEVCLFARPAAAWDVSASSRAPAGAAFGSGARGKEHVSAALGQIARAADLGIRSVLIADYGVLARFGRMRVEGVLPAEMKAKVSVMLAVGNPDTARVLVGLGADTLNVVPDLTVEQIADIRASVEVPIDMYIESPDDIGGFVRYHEIAELVRSASPIYIKLGLRNAPVIYPSGSHLESVAVALASERVRRARIALDALVRDGIDMGAGSQAGAAGLAIPVMS